MNNALLKDNLAAKSSGFSDAEGVFKVRSYSWIMFIFPRFFVCYSRWSGCNESKE